MRRAGPFVAITFAMLSPTAAEQIPNKDERIATIIRIFEENDCALTEDEANELFPAAGLIQKRDSRLFKGLVRDGAIKYDNVWATARLVAGEICSKSAARLAQDQADIEKTLVRAMEKSGCSLPESEMEAILPKYSLAPDTALPVVKRMIRNGEIVIDAQFILTLGTGKRCGKAGPSSNATASPRDRLIEAFEKQGCILTEKTFMEWFESESAIFISLIQEMDEEGEVAKGEGDAAILQIGETCSKRLDNLRSKLISELEAKNCVLTDNELRAEFGRMNTSREEAKRLVKAMKRTGDVAFEIVDADEQLVLKSGAVCGK